MRPFYFILCFCLLIKSIRAYQVLRRINKQTRGACFISREEIQDLILQRENYQSDKKYTQADEIKNFLEDNGVVVGRGKSWSLSSEEKLKNICAPINLVAKEILAKSKNFEKKIDDTTNSTQQDLLENLNDLLKTFHGKYFGGRKFADAAFVLALSGVTDEETFYLLEQAALSEIKRLGSRKRSGHFGSIFRICERLAAAGTRDQMLFRQAAELMNSLPAAENGVRESYAGDLMSGNFSLLSDRPMLWLSREAARAHKIQARFPVQEMNTPLDFVTVPAATKKHTHKYTIDISSFFSDPSLPLIVDLGCGFGVSLLGLSLLATDEFSESKKTRYNCLGCDLSPAGIKFANGIARRWKISSHCAFVNLSAEEALCSVQEKYTIGAVEWIIVNCPDPFSFQSNFSDDVGLHKPMQTSPGNRLLPSLSEFILTPDTISLIGGLLSTKSNHEDNVQLGCLLLQSNVEDVAVKMAELVEQTASCTNPKGSSSAALHWHLPQTIDEAYKLWRFSEVRPHTADKISNKECETPCYVSPKRQMLWKTVGGKRAHGDGWLQAQILPREARSETEVLYEKERKPIHRIVYTLPKLHTK